MASAGVDRNAPSGSSLGQKYRLLRPIGQGAFGCVYEAEHAELGRRCAIKLLHGAASSGRSRNRFAREARLLARLEHENVVSMLDAGEDPELGQYLVLEFIRGSTLRDAFVTFEGAPPQRVLEVVRQLARGLSHAHAAGVVHRDLKPENVMLTSHADGRPLVKILDFGVARIFDDEATITSSGAALGTAAYMAPEQARGDRDIDQRVDVYALGVIVYELFSGVRPFDGSSYNETLFQILTKPHAPLASLRGDLPRAVCDAVDRALCKDREERFASAEHFAAALGSALGGPQALETLGDGDTPDPGADVRAPALPPARSASRPNAVARRRASLAMVTAGLLPGLLIGAVFGLSYRSSRPGAESAASAWVRSSTPGAPATEPVLTGGAAPADANTAASASAPATNAAAGAPAAKALAPPPLPSAPSARTAASPSARAAPRPSAPPPARPAPRRDRGF